MIQRAKHMLSRAKNSLIDFRLLSLRYVQLYNAQRRRVFKYSMCDETNEKVG